MMTLHADVEKIGLAGRVYSTVRNGRWRDISLMHVDIAARAAATSGRWSR
jgi:hypothetical protein